LPINIEVVESPVVRISREVVPLAELSTVVNKSPEVPNAIDVVDESLDPEVTDCTDVVIRDLPDVAAPVVIDTCPVVKDTPVVTTVRPLVMTGCPVVTSTGEVMTSPLVIEGTSISSQYSEKFH
jgi:hypothetical protein